jgi:hypothetical protein
MDGLRHRERTLETKFQHDQLREFKILARRNHLFGLWAATLLNLPDDQAKAYAQNATTSHFCTVDGRNLLTKIIKDFQDHGIDITEKRAHKQLNHFYQKAAQQIQQESSSIHHP